jgi:hypothetical protein
MRPDDENNLPVPDGTYTFSQWPVYVDPNDHSIACGLVSIAQAIDRLAEAIRDAKTSRRSIAATKRHQTKAKE